MSYIPGSGEGAYEKGKKMKIASNLMVAHNIHLLDGESRFLMIVNLKRDTGSG